MSPTTPYPEGYDPESMLIGEDALPHRVLRSVTAAVGGTDRLPLRVIVYASVGAAASSMAPVPLNIVGVVALGLLAFDIGLHRRP